MAAEYEHELLSNEFDAMHFGFTPRGFTDQVYNCAVDAWIEVIQEKLLKEPLFSIATNDKKFRESLMNMLFTTGGHAFGKLMTEFTRYTSRYIFRISETVTLPVHQDVHRLVSIEMKEGESYSLSKETKKIRAKENNIEIKKLAVAEVKNRINDADEAIKQMRRMLEILQRRETDKQVDKEE